MTRAQSAAYPDMRASELVMSTLGDRDAAAKHWRKWRASLKGLTVEEFRAQMDGGAAKQ